MPELRLIVSNPLAVREDRLPVQDNITLFQPPLDTEFRVNVKNIGFNLYEILIQDPFHYLECELTLDIEEERMICHFPPIYDAQLKDFIAGDEVLYRIIMNQFQLKVLDQLLVFCSHYPVSHLIIYRDDAQPCALDRYREFLMSQDQAFAKTSERTEIIIPLIPKTFNAWITFM